jgi:folate-binding protein YgfZ
LINLKHTQLFRLQGQNIKAFLQGQVCSDVGLISDSSSQLTGICNAKGRLVASPYLLLKDGAYYVAIEQTMAEILFKYWKPYLMISRVQAELCKNLKAYGFLASSDIDATYSIQLAGNTQAQIIFTKDNLDAACETSALEWFNESVKSGVVIIQPETSKQLMPITLGYEKFGALSFNKGCYVGQEILARVHFKGSVKKEVVTIYFEEPASITAYEEIFDNNKKLVGHVAISPDAEMQVKSTLAVMQKNRDSSHLELGNGTLCFIR